ncbi:MAG: UDP-N-acetylglucosamine 2-epimerase (non-hydrolyzing) [Methanobacteriaceae archaeon]|nr:UDP-N-acetylglucosamine 2-epimerase (non-hydrolyzing) [Methanobacteriaceae archaeon]
MKIAVILGTRPEIIKMAPVIDEIKHRGHECIIIHTGQHYDDKMSHQFFIDLNLPIPDFNIHVGSASHAKQTSMMMNRLEDKILEINPDLVLIQGDTNAVLSGALTASKLNIPVGHVEAGLRSFDKTMPEELNRIIADACSHMYFVPTNSAAINLESESIPHNKIIVTGNTIVDACKRNLPIATKNHIITIPKGDYLVLTVHRAENTDNKIRLTNIIESIIELDKQIIFPIHPRTRNILKNEELYNKIKNNKNIILIEPLGYLDFLYLLSNSKLILTDSGGIQEEAITLSIPCVTLRYNTERPETIKVNANVLVGTDKEKIVSTVNNILNNNEKYEAMTNNINPYGDGTAAIKILDYIINLFNSNKLSIKPNSDVVEFNKRQLIQINKEITVGEYEQIHKGCIINMVFNNGNQEYVENNLNLCNKQAIITYFNRK